jgi:hypothetical protein
MLRKITLAGLTAAGVAVAGLAAANALGQYTMYEYSYYSDETLSEEVGWAIETCVNGQIILNQAHGTATQYYTTTPIGNCMPGGGGGPF